MAKSKKNVEKSNDNILVEHEFSDKGKKLSDLLKQIIKQAVNS
ncbi:hypothetical protein PQ743_05715 [Thermoanaerobacterium thermosaccharolyticum]|nr:hypothetical protein [Thermoanaerobacterium thermosaccharolyticum]